jgi:hypothetical protein
MLEGFFYGQKKLPIILFSYIVPIRKENIYMAISRKHFEQLARILGVNNASHNLITDISSFCKIHNRNFNQEKFISKVETIRAREKEVFDNLDNETITALSTGQDIDGQPYSIIKDPEFFLND